jgi:hypothetical protein
MKELFNDILSMQDVKGVMLLSLEGEIIFEEFVSPPSEEPGTDQWVTIIDSLRGIREADFVFERGRVYVRKSATGYLMVFLGAFAPSAMLRLNCDILLPFLQEANTSKGLGRLFKKK